MAHHKSAIKRSRQNEKKRIRNRHQRTTLRSSIRNLEQAIEDDKKKGEIQSLLLKTTKTIDKASSKGLIHRNKASRNVSRLTRKAKAALSAA